MKLSIKTKQFQELVSKAIRCSSNNKLIPITSYMEIRVTDKRLILTTTDATNYFMVSQDIDSEEFSIVVEAEKFSKLVSKMTSENLTFVIEKQSFTFSGGKSNYKIELPLDADGSVLSRLPLPSMDVDVEPQHIKVADIKSIIATAKSSLATTLEVPAFASYFVGDSVLSTDMSRICCIKDKLVDTPVLISPITMDLLEIMPEDDEPTINYYSCKDGIVFGTKNCRLITKASEGIETYLNQMDVLMGLVDSTFENVCEVRKDDLLQALDRLSLFVGVYDRNVIQLEFKKDCLVLKNKKNEGVEELDYIKECSGVEFSCATDVELLKEQIKVNSTDNVVIHYGLENCIKIIDGNATQIISLITD